MKGVTEGLGAQALAADLGMSLSLSVHADSSAAIGICRRSGVGRVRHLAVGQLWVQDHLRRGTFRLYKVRGSENPADLCTKHLARSVIDGLIEICGIVRETGRAASAPRLNVEVEPLPAKPPRGTSALASLALVPCSLSSFGTSPLTGLSRIPPRLPTSAHLRQPTTRPPRTLTYLHLQRHHFNETTTSYWPTRDGLTTLHHGPNARAGLARQL